MTKLDKIMGFLCLFTLALVFGFAFWGPREVKCAIAIFTNPSGIERLCSGLEEDDVVPQATKVD